MFILSVTQAAFGVAALLACLFAVRSVLRHQRTLSFYVTLSGALTLVFFLAIPGTPQEMILISLVVIAAGALLIPTENQRSTRELLDDDIEIGVSTATRRLKR